MVTDAGHPWSPVGATWRGAHGVRLPIDTIRISVAVIAISVAVIAEA